MIYLFVFLCATTSITLVNSEGLTMQAITNGSAAICLLIWKLLDKYRSGSRKMSFYWGCVFTVCFMSALVEQQIQGFFFWCGVIGLSLSAALYLREVIHQIKK